MKTSAMSAVTVAMLAMFAVAGCSDEGGQGSLSQNSGGRFPQRGGSEDTSPGRDPDDHAELINPNLYRRPRVAPEMVLVWI